MFFYLNYIFIRTAARQVKDQEEDDDDDEEDDDEDEEEEKDKNESAKKPSSKSKKGDQVRIFHLPSVCHYIFVLSILVKFYTSASFSVGDSIVLSISSTSMIIKLVQVLVRGLVEEK